MTVNELIIKSANYLKKHAPKYNIKVYSPIIAQILLESDKGRSELAVNANNFVGIKYNAGRCPTCIGVYHKVGSEQNPDGSYASSVMKWCKFKDLEGCIVGYLDFINIARYSNLKGETDPKTFLEKIKADGYATSLKYVENVYNVITSYNLIKYDPASENKNSSVQNTVNNTQSTTTKKKLKINVHAGHNPDGKIACGAVGLIKESTEARKVKDKVISMLKNDGHTVYDCSCENGTSQQSVLNNIVTKCNSYSVDLDVSIHFNAGGSKTKNSVTTGTEVFIYSATSKAKPYAENILKNISSLGFKNRGLKVSNTLYFLKNTKSPAVLIECCFVDDPDDIALYNADKMAKAIVDGINMCSTEEITGNYIHQGLNYSHVFDPEYYSNSYVDIRRTFGNDTKLKFNHFIQYGMNEGRVAKSTFNVKKYMGNYKDLRDAFGNDYKQYYKHFIQYGLKEGRRGT